jgi:anaerobic magnesium-protoporphyrin IX monomethyl ester cyclase
MKIQLFVPPGGYFAERWSKGSTMPTLGLLSIGAVLERAGVGVEIVPADVLKMSWGEIRRKIARDRADIVGVTSTTENRFQSFRLIRIARRANPGALTVMGGPHASLAAADTLDHLPELDVIVKGEGEMTTLELCRAWEARRDVVRHSGGPGTHPSVLGHEGDVARPGGGHGINPSVLGHEGDLAALADVPGLVLRRDGRAVATARRPPIADLDTLPRPAFHLVPFEKYGFRIEVPGHGLLPAVNVMTSRGCPFACNFCATPVNWGRHVRVRSPENVVAEIEHHVRTRGIKVIFFYDDTFNVDPGRVERICDLLIERRLDVFWRAEVRLDLITKPLLEKMKRAGMFHISFGLEAGSERVRNRVIGKKIDIQDFHHVVAWCLELGIVPNAFFIFSHPTETWEEAQESVRIIERYRGRVESTIAVLHVYPGTPLEATAREIGLLPPGFSWSERRPKGVVTLPTAQGDVPLFLDRLTWAQMSELLFRWSLSGGRVSLLRKIPRALLRIRSFGDFKRYAIMAAVLLRLKLGKRRS